MARASEFTDEHKLPIALDLLGGDQALADQGRLSLE